MQNYCGCGIREENENQGGQGKDRREIKGGDFGKISNHGRVYVDGKMIGRGNSLASRWICCQQPGATETNERAYLSIWREQRRCNAYVHSRVNKDTMYSEVSAGIVLWRVILAVVDYGSWPEQEVVFFRETMGM